MAHNYQWDEPRQFTGVLFQHSAICRWAGSAENYCSCNADVDPPTVLADGRLDVAFAANHSSKCTWIRERNSLCTCARPQAPSYSADLRDVGHRCFWVSLRCALFLPSVV